MLSSDNSVSLLDNKTVRRTHRQEKRLNDPFFAVLFAFNTLLVFSVSIVYGIPALIEQPPRIVHIVSDGAEETEKHVDYSIAYIFGVLLLAVISGLLSISFVYAMSQFSDYVIHNSLKLLIIVSFCVGLAMLFSGLIAGGILLLLLCISTAVFLYYIEPRIRFASMNLQIACEAISSMPRLYWYTVCTMGAEVVWCVLWGMAAYGMATNSAIDSIRYEDTEYALSHCSTYVYGANADSSPTLVNGMELTCSYKHCKACFCGKTFIGNFSCFREKFYVGWYVLMLISIFWACSVFSNVIHCATAGAISIWWRTPGEADEAVEQPKGVLLGVLSLLGVQRKQSPSNSRLNAAVEDSFLNAVGCDFGSICLGSLLVALIKGLRSSVSFLCKQLTVALMSDESLFSNKVNLQRPVGNKGIYKEVAQNVNMNASQQRTPSTPMTFGAYVALYLLRCLEVVLRLLDFAMEYFNRYAFTYVAVYGYQFTDASK